MTALPLLALLQAPAPDGGMRNFAMLAMYAIIFAIFYFLMIRPQQKARKAQEELIQSLKKGDEVVTAGGIIGKVVHIKETLKDGAMVRTPEDQVTIESGTSRLVVERQRIVRIKGAPAAATTTTA